MAVKQAKQANCPGFAVCPAGDGTVAGCKANCQCVYCGDSSMVAQCNSQCVQSGGGVSVGVNPAPVQSAIGSVSAGLQNALLTPIEQSLPMILEKTALFLFALLLVIVGFLTVKS